MKLKRKINHNKAFSLVEISIVIIIVGILIAGVSNGISLYADSRLTIARNLTLNSPVNRIGNLEMWLETTNDKAFSSYSSGKYDLINNIKNNQAVAKWNNIRNIENIPENRDGYQINSANQPKYTDSSINGLPALYFDGKTDGTGDYLNFNGLFMNGLKDITIFIVEKRTAYGTPSTSPAYPTPYQYIICGTNGASLVVGYIDNNVRIDTTLYSGGFALEKSYIHTFQKDGVVGGNKIYLNGSLKVSSGTTTTITINSYNNYGLYIAYFNRSWTQNFYTGFIGEIIIYSKVLNNKERVIVEEYLAQKWQIKL